MDGTKQEDTTTTTRQGKVLKESISLCFQGSAEVTVILQKIYSSPGNHCERSRRGSSTVGPADGV